MIERPLLAATLDADKLDQLEYPVLVSPKFDGIRTLIHHEHGPVSRKFKAIPNRHIHTQLNWNRLYGLDGELVVEEGTFNETQSAVMSIEGRPEVSFWVFDDFTYANLAFEDRLLELGRRLSKLSKLNDVRIRQVSHYSVFSPEQLEHYASLFAAQGYEGVMIRDPRGHYKQGRSTLSQGILLKLKDFADAEGVVTGYEERLRNDNVAKTNRVGEIERSAAKAGKKGMDTLGALVVDTQWGELRIGTGFDDVTRKKLWNDRDSLIGRTVTFKYQASGMADKPRFPVFMRFRED